MREKSLNKLKISILDVGHGDFIYAETPLNQNLVIDCGSGDDITPSGFLSSVTAITELQISHPHTDHFDDIESLANKDIQSFRCPSLDQFSDDVIGWKRRDQRKINKLRELKHALCTDNNAVVCQDGFSHTVWHPNNIDSNNPNTCSLVTTLSYAGFKMLFGGDLPIDGWNNLLSNPSFVHEIQGTTVFKVPHHGRANACSNELFKHITPKLCVISDKSLSKDNLNTASTQWYTDRSAGCIVSGCTDKRKVLTTRNDGSIHINISSNGNWSVYTNTTWK